jgi:hypothetical protein|tara:strand:+ start:93 stop:362 length:270 start_codon:yes stop_codon:yes gene_type:complete
MKVNKVELEKFKDLCDSFQTLEVRMTTFDLFLKDILYNNKHYINMLDPDLISFIEDKLMVLQDDLDKVDGCINWFTNLKDVEVEEDGIL